MIPIVFSTDHNYVMAAGITIASLLMAAEGELYDIYVMISSDVTEEDKERLSLQVKTLSPDSCISYVNMEKYYNGAYEIRGISKAAYYRLLIPWLIPNLDKIIYSDVDIIFKTSLRPIFDMDLEDNFLGVAENIYHGAWIDYKKYFDKLGVDYLTYFNSGLLVFNSKLQREQNLDKEYEKLTKQKFLYQDQDILNIVCKGRTAFFDCRFNLPPTRYLTEPKYSGKVAIHYAGEKPWNTFTFSWAEWWEVYNKSIFMEEGYYSKICRKILSPKHQIKVISRKAKSRLQILKRKL